MSAPGLDDDDDRPIDDAEERPVAVGAVPVTSGQQALDDDAHESATADAGLDAARDEGWLGATTTDVSDVPPMDEFAQEKPRMELLAGVLAAALALGIFMLPWYRSLLGGEITGFRSGNLGPVAFGLAIAALLIVALRFAKVPLSFPVDAMTMVELIGWLCVGIIVLKRIVPALRPEFAVQQTSRWFVVVLLAVGLVFVAGNAATTAYVLRPGWFASRAGKLGALVVGVPLLLGIVAAFVVKPPGRAEVQTQRPRIEQGLPACARGFPVPAGVRATQGGEVPGSTGGQTPGCVVGMQSTLRYEVVASRLRAGFTRLGWAFRQTRPTPGTVVFQLTKGRCGTVQVTMVGQGKAQTSVASAFLRPC